MNSIQGIVIIYCFFVYLVKLTSSNLTNYEYNKYLRKWSLQLSIKQPLHSYMYIHCTPTTLPISFKIVTDSPDCKTFNKLITTILYPPQVYNYRGQSTNLLHYRALLGLSTGCESLN